MSEYQYFEFQAVDRPLSSKEMAELRAYSTRAQITPTTFVNDYSWGNFKGDADAWMATYFDAFLYLANWGTHILKLRLPGNLLSAKTARLYTVGEHASVRVKSGNVILSFCSENEDGDDLVESEGWLATLISVRAELAHDDLRALYLGWLLCVQNGELEPSDPWPPVPVGLSKLSASLSSFVDFLRVDRDLLRLSAKRSAQGQTVADLLYGNLDLAREGREARRRMQRRGWCRTAVRPLAQQCARGDHARLLQDDVLSDVRGNPEKFRSNRAEVTLNSSFAE